MKSIINKLKNSKHMSHMAVRVNYQILILEALKDNYDDMEDMINIKHALDAVSDNINELIGKHFWHNVETSSKEVAWSMLKQLYHSGQTMLVSSLIEDLKFNVMGEEDNHLDPALPSTYVGDDNAQSVFEELFQKEYGFPYDTDHPFNEEKPNFLEPDTLDKVIKEFIRRTSDNNQRKITIMGIVAEMVQEFPEYNEQLEVAGMTLVHLLRD